MRLAALRTSIDRSCSRNVTIDDDPTGQIERLSAGALMPSLRSADGVETVATDMRRNPRGEAGVAMAAADGPTKGADERTPLARRFTRRYVAAILAVALVAVIGERVSNNNLSRIEAATVQLEAASDQIGRVASIGALAQEVDDRNAVGDVKGAQAAASTLEQEARALTQTQDGLVGGDATLGLPATGVPPALEELYSGGGRLLEQIGTLSAEARLLAGFSGPGENEAANRVEPLRAIIQGEDRLLEDLEQAVNLYGDEVNSALEAQSDANRLLLLLSAVVAGGAVLGLFLPMARQIKRETSQLEAAERVQRENSERQGFRSDLTKALEGCEDEAEALAAAGRALQRAAPDRAAEVLVPTPLGDRLEQGVTASVGSPDCPVSTPEACLAVRSGRHQVYESSRMLNVCPKLPAHAGPPSAAVCVPLIFNGQSLGVLHATVPEPERFDTAEVERLNTLAQETAVRIGTLRITRATERLARSDSLTELDNRRTLIEHVGALVAEGVPFSVAIADLDHFKDLNDTFGHEVGDRALQQFAACLRTALRPNDLVARWGGEEFVLVLPETPLSAAAIAIERVQESLPGEIAQRNGVPFTASWGLADSSAGRTFEQMLSAADLAMYEAKRAGRNRLVVADIASSATPDELG
jgi:diguanylate cyclase (GGDEF)-like protein